MGIVDAVIIILLILGIMAGLKRGLVKQLVLLIGLVGTLVISFYLKNPVATLLYKHLPFFEFGGIFKSAPVLNILLYEVLAFLMVFSVLYLVLRILLKVSGLIESLLKATVILGFFSKIIGGLVGFIESYVIVFVALFILNQPFVNINGLKNELEKSQVSNFILNKTPILSSITSDAKIVVDNVYEYAKMYKDNPSEFNKQITELFIKYEIISKENIDYLKEKGKIE